MAKNQKNGKGGQKGGFREFGYCRHCGCQHPLNLIGECEVCHKAKLREKRERKAQQKRQLKVMAQVRDYLEDYIRERPEAAMETLAGFLGKLPAIR